MLDPFIAKPGHPDPLALRPREASKALGIGERLLWDLTKRGQIPHTRVGRCVLYPVDGLRTWLADRVKGGPSNV